MKQPQRTFAVTLLICLLSLNAFAGVMDAPVDPPPPQDTVELTKAATQQPSESITLDPEIQVVLNIVMNLLSMF